MHKTNHELKVHQTDRAPGQAEPMESLPLSRCVAMSGNLPDLDRLLDKSAATSR
ncbi:hypothetical protein [Nonomuraea sp. NPDC049695]|uniref:hypothetical protein n=1 Tax=Nonomuraea sp. NPDC049695 TaxID=3154734 RepID=UPI00342C37F0